MPDYIPITEEQSNPFAPLTSELVKQLRDNPIALAQGVAGAPRVRLDAIERLEPGEHIRSRNDSTHSSDSGPGWSTRHGFNFMQFGEIRVTFEHRLDFGTPAVQARVQRWRNGSTSTVQSFGTTSGSFVSRSVDVEVKPGDRVFVEHQGGITGIGPDQQLSRSQIRHIRFQTDGQTLWPGSQLRLENPDPPE